MPAWLAADLKTMLKCSVRTRMNVNMKRTNRIIILIAFICWATAIRAQASPTITSLRLNGQAQTGNDPVHFYLSYSASPGALVYFKATVSGVAPFNYQWQ